MEFTPPSCSLGIDNSIDPTPVSFVPPYLKEPMLAQPNLHGSKGVKFAEPMVQGIFFDAMSVSTLVLLFHMIFWYGCHGIFSWLSWHSQCVGHGIFSVLVMAF